MAASPHHFFSPTQSVRGSTAGMKVKHTVSMHAHARTCARERTHECMRASTYACTPAPLANCTHACTRVCSGTAGLLAQQIMRRSKWCASGAATLRGTRKAGALSPAATASPSPPSVSLSFLALLDIVCRPFVRSLVASLARLCRSDNGRRRSNPTDERALSSSTSLSTRTQDYSIFGDGRSTSSSRLYGCDPVHIARMSIYRDRQGYPVKAPGRIVTCQHGARRLALIADAGVTHARAHTHVLMHARCAQLNVDERDERPARVFLASAKRDKCRHSAFVVAVSRKQCFEALQ